MSWRVSVGGREVALLRARLVGEVAAVLVATRVPRALGRVHAVEAVVGAGAEARVAEDEELGLGPEVGGVADARLLEVVLAFVAM